MEDRPEAPEVAERQWPPYLRLAWSNPTPPPPARPINLALAIERHLEGRYGLSNNDFAHLFATGGRAEPT